MFYEKRTPTTSSINIWTTGGQRSFASDPGTQMANFGTDGVTMVWTAHHGDPDELLSDWVNDETQLMSAPFTTDPSAVSPRQVAVTHGVGPGGAWVVGCGHAALPSGWIARLGDGAHAELGKGFEDQLVFGVSCTEVFLFSSGDLSGVTRVRLDSLVWSP